MKFLSVPNSLALIPDGNRRWAKAHSFSILDGYSLGVKKFIDFSEWCKDYGIRNLSVWALSSENLRRHSGELNALFSIYRRVCKDKGIIGRLEENNVKVNIIGNREIIPKDLYAMLKVVETRTENNTGGVINMLIGYGGKDDMMYAARNMADMAKRGEEITESAFQGSLMSSSIPNIDFIIRTSGEQRLSGFMPWQTGYSELYFSKKLWPDFTRKDLYYALADYDKRERRFGK
ncbi:MAG: di-trans,poly-cis-decaprenylcistransferase [Candidatus Micrarchaeota archaeon]|nr:di-trans,poly-cis-decaprenylcistransferase [Candidatus Micrarchaeota archaeon]MDE1834428.1 di-trans,poly-cis-decaprenylcistransferase [Candidatus Micrarchaeota archaeon]MDE1859677.1 di-trans,poly-cis-decaprenylcistransferase [Candidatus Micrarchaeota archaeon]